MFDKIPDGLTELGTFLITSVTTYFLSRRKHKAEMVANELSNIESAVKIYHDMCQNLKGEIDELRYEMKSQQKQLADLECENAMLRKKLAVLEEKV